MIKSSEYRVAKHPNGKRLIIGNDTRLFTTPGKLANALQVGETSAWEILQGTARMGWQIKTMKRRRENMKISYELTNLGRKVAFEQRQKVMKNGRVVKYPFADYQVFLQNAECGEASDVSEKMLSLGMNQFCRLKVLQLGSEMIKQGYLVKKEKESGAIFGNV